MTTRTTGIRAGKRDLLDVAAIGKAEVERFFDGLELLDPGVVVAHQWRPRPASGPSLVTDAQSSLYAGVARKP